MNFGSQRISNSSTKNIILASLSIFFLPWLCHKLVPERNSTITIQTHISNDVLHAISGSIASALSITLFYPLESIRTRLQVNCSSSRKGCRSTLWLVYDTAKNKNEGGISSLYRGWASLVLALMTLNFVYFYCFRVMRRWLDQRIVHNWIGTNNANSHSEEMGRYKIAVDLVVGYAAGVVGVLITGPLWMVNTRLKLQGLDIGGKGNKERRKKYDGVVHCLVAISKEEGILTLWTGTMTSIVLSLNPAIQVGVYELLKRHHSIVTSMSRIVTFFFHQFKEGTAKERSIDSNVVEPFLNALLAKFLATVITYPIQVVQTQHRAGHTISDMKHENESQKPNRLQGHMCRSWWFHDILTIVRVYGVRGLYRGLESKLLQTCLNSAFMFLIYENLLDFLRLLLASEE
ncbi:hypothetical protein HJC23_008173 [Cyclotella cryptica]|uniref:Mitochondrial carrier protein n=1 Tax=Cyclotella cryptica TaxID=29204 RepID=A0ABD3PMX0_9STRA|eukprot:CCRYP_013304-RA/>CCRYP_013304-RA protein AED:0.06 eAED:0.05 QI:0/-1/0/1/-1/1/1/0/402